MPIAYIDGQPLEFRSDERLNGIEAARRLGIEIPHYCWHPGLSVVGSCRMCLVETGMRDAQTGKVTMLPKLAPACNTVVRDGTVIITQSERVARARAMVEEDLLLRHPIDCPICDKAGECLLQDFHFRYGQKERRADLRPFTSRRRDLGDNITLFVDRCILCSRCVRFVREVAGTSELLLVNRGTHQEIAVLPEFPLNNKLSGNVVDLCPVGALGDKRFLYQQRVWYLKAHAGICTRCATGCSTWIEENQDRVYRIRPRENLAVNRWWICNDGRYDYPHLHDPRRLVQALRRDGGAWHEVNHGGLVTELNERFRRCGRIGAVLSPFLAVEEAYMLGRWARQLDPEALVALGPVPVVGEDERFPGGFVISAEKCPNRRGVEEVIAHFMHRVPTFDEVVEAADRGQLSGVWISGGYRAEWIDAGTAERLARAPLLVVHDLFPSPLSERATFVLPGAAFAERDGTYVNRHDHLQSMRFAIRPPAGVWPEGSLFWQLLGQPGLYQAEEVLRELAGQIAYFRPVGQRPIPETGFNLKVYSLAETGQTCGQV